MDHTKAETPVKPYYWNFPAAPPEFVALLVAVAEIPPEQVLCARVGTDNSLFLDVDQGDRWHFTAETLRLIGGLLRVSALGELYVEPSVLLPTALSITAADTGYDFAECFRGTRLEGMVIMGEEGAYGSCG